MTTKCLRTTGPDAKQVWVRKFGQLSVGATFPESLLLPLDHYQPEDTEGMEVKSCGAGGHKDIESL